MKTVYWTQESLDKLADIESYIISQEAVAAAKSLIKRLTERVDQIKRAPYSGRKVIDYEDDQVRELLERPYRIIYHVTEETIYILSVMHYRQLLPSKKQILSGIQKQ
ncbi:MAG: plasmid stabilization protein [Gammaproteobacteria bacterium]|nr:MAG: plasmid stabilization protein [Gammaproteobacteria bacterium]